MRGAFYIKGHEMKFCRPFPTLIALLVCASTAAFCGQSLALTPGVIALATDPNQPQQQAWRVEFQLHDWTPPTINTNDSTVWDFNGIGAASALLQTGILRISDKRDVAPSVCDLSLGTLTNILVRVQRDPVNMRFVCELWNYDGSGYQQTAVPIASLQTWPYAGGSFGSAYTTAKIAFFRIFDTIVPDGSRPPVTADSGDITELKFDGSLNDSSGNGHNVSLSSPAFQATPNQIPIAYLKTGGAPSWSAWISLRAGFPAVLDGTSSFSLADQSSNVSYLWQQISGPSTVRWSSQRTAKPVIRGLIFGSYRFRLQVTDVAGKIATRDLDVGAVAMDNNGVVIQANPAADVIFGPMIAFGKNPWPWEDQMTLHSATVRQPALNAISPPTWINNLAGTVNYTPGGASQAAQTTLANGVSSTDTAINVADATKLDFSNLPALLMIHTPSQWSPIEDVRICSVNGNTLTVCYDGRGWRASTYERVPTAQSWPAGSTVRQVETIGTATTFLTDFCPAGAGEPGKIVYTTGTVSVAPGSTTLSGSGTSWNNTLEGYRVRIQGTHAGGTSFVFFATVKTVSGAATIVLSRSWPNDADAGTGLSYAVLNPVRQIVRSWLRPDGSTGRQTSTISDCESDTRMYLGDIFANIVGDQSNQPYSYSETPWFTDFGPNYYDEVLAEYAGYFRSGNILFLNNARAIGDYWPTSPDFDEAWLGAAPRRVGATGMVAGAVLDGRVGNWYALRRLADSAVTGPYVGAILPSCDGDLRETAYNLSWIALAALFDPLDTGSPTDPDQRSFWKAQLPAALARDNKCKGPNSEFPGAYWAGSGSYQLTNGSATVTGTNISPSMCPVTASGTITVTNGLQIAVGTNFIADAKIIIMGQRQGQPYLFYSQYTLNSPTSITLASAYDGDTGSYSYQIESDIYWMSFAAGTFNDADHQLMNTLYACKWSSATTITLDRPWAGPTGTYGVYRYQELGYGIQPFFDGIKTMAMKWASLAADGQTATDYATLAANTANWVMTTGFDPPTGGLHYAREWAGCEPNENPRLGCTYSTSASDREKARFLNGEAQNAMRVAYEANPTDQNKAFGDEFYGAQWGKLGGPYHDDVYLSALENDGMWSYKWLGFLFGIGMAHQWPAVRVGGAQSAIQSQTLISFKLGTTDGAASARITVTAPSGAKQVYNCASSPCQVTVDRRQGEHLYRVDYLNRQGLVIRHSDAEILAVQ